MNSCLICCEDFNKSTHKQVSCQWCDFTACRSCCQTYILDQQETVCMNKSKTTDGKYLCQKAWTRKFVTDTFPNTWVNNEWKNMNAKIAFDTETALLPATLNVIETRKEIDDMKDEIDFIDAQIKLLNERRWNLKHQIHAGGSVQTTKTHYVARKCPDENCRGYLSSQWKCGICDKYTCSKCHIIKGNRHDTEHICHPDNVATAQLLANDTKPCPKCSTLIHKIDGCDQMWCTQCHTAFSWKRGTIETRIHNPHFYEWQRQQNGGNAPRNFGDFECGRDMDEIAYIQRQIYIILNRKNCMKNLTIEQQTNTNLVKNNISNIVHKNIHLHEVEARRFITNNVVDNLELRVKFLLKEINETQFKSKIHNAYKAHEKKKDISNVIQLQIQVVNDIIHRLYSLLKPDVHLPVNDPNTAITQYQAKKIINIYQEIHTITEYSNSILKQHANTYNCKVWNIDYTTRNVLN